MFIPTSYNFEFSDDGPLVYFNVNIKQLFEVNATYPGMRRAVRKAFDSTKKYVPYKTGLLRSSYTVDMINKHIYMIYFDPQPLMRKGNVYYAKYLKEKNKTNDWLEIIMMHFFNALIKEVKKLKQKQDISVISILVATKFFSELKANRLKRTDIEKKTTQLRSDR